MYVLDHKLPHVPGTVLLDDYAAQTEEFTHSLKHATGTDAHIVLSPQPSEDPNDPLNWPKWKKELIVAILCLGAMLNAGTNVSENVTRAPTRLICIGAISQRIILRDS